MPEVHLDFAWQDWPFAVQLAYRDVVKVNPQYAAVKIGDALEAVRDQVKAEFGDVPDDWEPPEDWVPAALLNIDPRYLLGFVWIAERRHEPGLRFDDLIERMDYQGLIVALMTELAKEAPEAPDPAPLVEEPSQPTAPSSPRSKSNSPRAKSSAGG
jgi:hypothetical protein